MTENCKKSSKCWLRQQTAYRTEETSVEKLGKHKQVWRKTHRQVHQSLPFRKEKGQIYHSQSETENNQSI